jgi:hypothetical protein
MLNYSAKHLFNLVLMIEVDTIGSFHISFNPLTHFVPFTEFTPFVFLNPFTKGTKQNKTLSKLISRKNSEVLNLHLRENCFESSELFPVN